jgi:carboxylesterase
MRVLCLHGLGGSGATMWPLVGSLSSAQHTVLAPTLPGHGSEPADLVGVTWADWLSAASDWPADVVVGQSMGACLALALAAQGQCRAVVAINPLVADADAVEGLAWRKSRGHERVDIGASAVGEIAYEWLPIEALQAMHDGIAEVDLASVTVPTLIVTSANDDIVDPAGSGIVAAALGGPVERLTLDNGGHVATLDTDRGVLCAAVARFIATLSQPTG